MSCKMANDKRQLVLSATNQVLLITWLVLLIASICSASANNNNNNNDNKQQDQNAYLQRPDSNGRPQLMVAVYCANNAAKSYHNQYLEIGSRKWRSDRDTTATCTKDKQELLNYCRKVYPNHDIRNIVESSRPYKIDNWCKLGSPKRRCRTRLAVKPYRCLEGTFQSDALLVPEGCSFDHEHNKSICQNPDYWNGAAVENCQKHANKLKLQSFAMLQPCGLDLFSGVEFVCCPSIPQQSNNRDVSMAKAASTDQDNSFVSSAANGNSKLDVATTDEKLNEINSDEELPAKKHHDQQQSDSDDQEESAADNEDDDDEEYDDDEDEYDDDSSSWNEDKPSSSSSTTSTTTTTTTTTTTERPIDHYLSHFDLAHEHDEFRRAELAVEANYRDKINHVMKEWSQLDGRFEEMKKKDPQAAEEFKKKMTHQFQKTIEALEEEGAVQRHQLASMHAERAMAIINRRKKTAMDCLTKALDRMPIRVHQVEKCIVKLLKALEKDRTHTLHQYKNLLNLNTREALREKRIILEHLVTLNRAANQSIAMLDRSPMLVENLKSKIIALWHKLRNIPLEDPIVRESELKIMEMYEEEVAQRKIERERQRLVEQEATQDTPHEPSVAPTKEKKESSTQAADAPKAQTPSAELQEQQTTQASITNKPEQIDSTTISTVQTPNVQSGSRSLLHDGSHGDIDNEIHYPIDSAKFSHLKADPPSHHELSYSFKHEPIETQLRFGYVTFLVTTCTVVIVLALIGIKYYSKHSTRAYRRQGFAEVGRSCPDEKSVTHMQFNGYENPAYKFFEAEA